MYDYLDQAYASRKLYIKGINRRIAGRGLQQAGNVDRLLAMACGTGRRATRSELCRAKIIRLSGSISVKEMVEQTKTGPEIMHAKVGTILNCI